MNRKKFIQIGAAASAGMAVPKHPVFADGMADQKKRVGLIGTGWYGKMDLLRLIQVAPVEVVSLCDVDSRMLSEAAELVAGRQLSKKTPRTYSDYRKMLSEKDLDLVLIATPDHWHALPMIAAVESGADVYVQKPIGVDVIECQAMVAAARKHGRVVQVGLQRRSTPHLIEARDLIKEGRLGRIGLVETYCYSRRPVRNPPNEPPPDHLDFEMWTGPAPMRPYNAGIHPLGWRNYMEYGNGTIGDMGVHMIDAARWMLDLGWPRRIFSAGGNYFHGEGKPNISDMQTVTFDYGKLQMTWQHRHWAEKPDPNYPWGATFYGEKGTLKIGLKSFDFTPVGKGNPIHRGWDDADAKYPVDSGDFPEDRTEKRIELHAVPATRRHMRNLLGCIASRGRPCADIAEGSTSTTMCVLANLSLQLGRSLAWGADVGRVVGDAEANALLARPYRAPWVHPVVEKT
ncbi:MAG: Gfo/Idh/MocA family oxidoreductase [Kiritimatiellales bacterium]|nr:Gfo/Idh/MocA family oxidoreductase [Kiritimatiellales bacterium]